MLRARHLACAALLCFASAHASSADNQHAHDAHAPAPVAPTLGVTVSPLKQPKAGDLSEVLMTLQRKDNGAPIMPDDLQTVHTQRIHLLIVDPTLTDYHHLHPRPARRSGQYSFSFTPRMSGPYRMWVNVTPEATGREEILRADIGTLPDMLAPPPETINDTTTVGGTHFRLSFDPPPRAGIESTATLAVTDKKGQPFAKLRPILGAFAHIVGFHADLQSVIHVHPLGKEPTHYTERGGPELQFKLTPLRPGFMKLFAQVRIDQRELTVPFGVRVAE